MSSTLRAFSSLLTCGLLVLAVGGCVSTNEDPPTGSAEESSSSQADPVAALNASTESVVREVLGELVVQVRVTVMDGAEPAQGERGNTLRCDVELASELTDERQAYDLLTRLHTVHPTYPVCQLSIAFPLPDGSGVGYNYYWNPSDGPQRVAFGVMSARSLVFMDYLMQEYAWDSSADIAYNGRSHANVSDATLDRMQAVAQGSVELPEHVPWGP